MGNKHCNKIEPINLDNKKFKDIIKNLMPTWYLENIELTDLDFNRVRNSWELVNKKNTYLFCSKFYDRLFDFHPELKIFFKNDIKIQANKLFQMINILINSMDKDINELNKIIQKIVISHLNKKIKASYYRIICDNLIKTLEEVLNLEFDENTKLSWEKVLSNFINLLIPSAVYEELKFNYGKPGISSK
jgi:hemoglobin-like flavoprotein